MVPMKRSQLHLYEYARHEGNHSLGNSLRAARFEEEVAAEQASKKNE